MKRLRSLRSVLGATVFVSTGLALSCSSPDDTVPPGDTGGSGGTAMGTGGSVAGSISGGVGPTGGTAPATGGSSAGVAGTPPGTGGSVAGTGGSDAGGSATGGTGGGASGMSGSAGGGGRGGGGGSGPQGGGGGASGASGTGGTGGSTPSSGCGKAAPMSMRYSMDVSGTMREYILAVPMNYDPMRAYRLIFAWHPLGGSAQQTAGNGSSGYYGMQGASMGAAILVSPEGLEQSGGGNRGWWNQNGADIAFFRALLDKLKSEMCIDEKRVFSTGFSFGGMFSFSVGCTGLVRAIAPMAGNPQVSGCTNGSTPVAMMGFHGDDDTVVNISGGRQGRDIFIERNGCMMTSMPTTPSWCDGLQSSNQPCTCVSYQGCQAGYPVTWCEFNGPHTPAPNSASTIWNFFSQF
jgi:poly(3-hydroxybutyrate) depolymerase